MITVCKTTLAFAIKQPDHPEPNRAFAEAWAAVGDGAPLSLTEAFCYGGRTFYTLRADQLFIVHVHFIPENL